MNKGRRKLLALVGTVPVAAVVGVDLAKADADKTVTARFGVPPTQDGWNRLWRREVTATQLLERKREMELRLMDLRMNPPVVVTDDGRVYSEVLDRQLDRLRRKS